MARVLLGGHASPSIKLCVNGVFLFSALFSVNKFKEKYETCCVTASYVELPSHCGMLRSKGLGK